jgi:hypothetical protein
MAITSDCCGSSKVFDSIHGVASCQIAVSISETARLLYAIRLKSIQLNSLNKSLGILEIISFFQSLPPRPTSKTPFFHPTAEVRSSNDSFYVLGPWGFSYIST